MLPALEARYQMHLTPLAGGAEARTFAGDGLVFKVYPHLPARRHLRRAARGPQHDQGRAG